MKNSQFARSFSWIAEVRLRTEWEWMGSTKQATCKNTHAHVKCIQMAFPKSSWSMSPRIYLSWQCSTCILIDAIPFHSNLLYSILFYCGLLYSKPCCCIIYCILLCDIVRISWYHLGTTLQSGKYQISHSYQTAQLLQQISNIIYHTCVNVSGTRGTEYWASSTMHHVSPVHTVNSTIG